MGVFEWTGGVRKMTGRYSRKPTRPDGERLSGMRGQYLTNRKIILATQSICAICGKPVDKTLKYPHPMSATVDHIIPVAKNGDPASLDNPQLAHRYCNRQKSDKLPGDRKPTPTPQRDINRDLPLAMDWSKA